VVSYLGQAQSSKAANKFRTKIIPVESLKTFSKKKTFFQDFLITLPNAVMV